MFDEYIVSKHVLERYAQRVQGSTDNILRRIEKDLSIKKTKYIFDIGCKRHVFSEYGKQFVFERCPGVWVLKTVIKRNRTENNRAIRSYKAKYNAAKGER